MELGGPYGEELLVDPFDPTSGETVLLDRTVWGNASTADRRYQAIVLTGDYRPAARWNIGGNWTWSELTGNQEGLNRATINATAIGTYQRSRPEEAAAPDGCLANDVRHRINVWGNHRSDLGNIGAPVLVRPAITGRDRGGRSVTDPTADEIRLPLPRPVAAWSKAPASASAPKESADADSGAAPPAVDRGLSPIARWMRQQLDGFGSDKGLTEPPDPVATITRPTGCGP